MLVFYLESCFAIYSNYQIFVEMTELITKKTVGGTITENKKNIKKNLENEFFLTFFC